jgi:hypothetical protein
MNGTFELGPIRPPSEAKSLLIRLTRNCPWNKCAFCHTYRGTKFELRPVEEIKDDIRAIRAMVDRITETSWKYGHGGRITRSVANYFFESDEDQSDGIRSVVAWLYFGGESVFLQDANSIIMKTDDLAAVLDFIREQFPQVKRITSYCRSKTAARKSVEELKRLKEAGLSRIHIGLESGCDPVLDFIKKGSTAADHIQGGRNVVAAGISLSEYVIPGLGGDRWSRSHAVETAKVLNAINPDFIRLRTLQVVPGTELYTMRQEGAFRPLPDEEILKEIRLFIETLEGITSTIVSDHILNLLEELEGKLPEDKPKLLAVIDRFFALPDRDRLIYRLGRRKGIYRRLDDLSDAYTYDRLGEIIDSYATAGNGAMDRDLTKIMQQYI